jgi:hypothetical protein
VGTSGVEREADIRQNRSWVIEDETPNLLGVKQGI